MNSLTSKQTAHILRLLLQHSLKELEANPQFTISNLLPLLVAVEHPNVTQPEVAAALNMHPTKDGATLSRQLRYLRGKRQGVVQSPLRPVIHLEPLESDNRVNTVVVTTEGEKFINDLTKLFNKLLAKAEAKTA